MESSVCLNQQREPADSFAHSEVIAALEERIARLDALVAELLVKNEVLRRAALDVDAVTLGKT